MDAISRRNFLKLLPASMLLPSPVGSKEMPKIISREIPSSAEVLPAIGLGTWRKFNVPDQLTDPLAAVLRSLFQNGGKVVDTSPMYGRAEKVIGNLSEDLRINDKLFLPTKVWTSDALSGINQINESFKFLQRARLDLVQVHNLVDWKNHLPTLLSLRDRGLVRYVGITHYLEDSYFEMEKILKNYPIDFIQVNYSIVSRRSADKLLPAARDKKVAVIVNRPFEEGSLFGVVAGKKLPDWSAEIGCRTWAQFFLKFILANPAVVSVIPATSNPDHMIENLAAAYQPLPDGRQLERMMSIFRV